MSEIKVNSIKGVGASAAAITVNNTDGTCTANITNRTNKNLIINGAMAVQQRMTSATTGGQNLSGIKTVDRFSLQFSGTDNSPTQIPVDVASGTTPYTLGFRKAFKAINGNQTSGAGASDTIVMLYRLEGQDLANSGWNYTSSSSYITFSYWVKSSVAQNFFVTLKSGDGTPQKYATETGSLSADTWTKVTKTILGNSNIQFDNDNGEGLEIEWSIFRGTDQTGSMSLNAWAANNNSVRTPDQTSTWYTTDDATFEITGVQLEVSDHATDFEHRSFGQELALCQRYFEQYNFTSFDYEAIMPSHNTNTSGGTLGVFPWRVEKRATPTITLSGDSTFRLNGGGAGDTQATSMSISRTGKYTTKIDCNASRSQTTGLAGYISRQADSTTFIQISAEL